MADWNTARGGNAECTLTAATGPSPRDPYRQALYNTAGPSLKVRPLVSYTTGRLQKGSRFLHWSQGKHGSDQNHNRLILLSLSADFNGSAQLALAIFLPLPMRADSDDFW